MIRQLGRTVVNVIIVIALIALILFLCTHCYQTKTAKAKAEEIAQAVAERIQIYHPDFQKYTKRTVPSKAYDRNGPYDATITIQDERETPLKEQKKGYFSVTVLTDDDLVCQKLVETDVFKADFITIDGSEDGICPGLIRFYFIRPKLPAPKTEDLLQDIDFHQESDDQAFWEKEAQPVDCQEPTPYYKEKGHKCVECLTASQCSIKQDCVQNKCKACPPFSSRKVRLNQRIGRQNCYCNIGYQLNKAKTGCVIPNEDWDSTQYCVGNVCSACPNNASFKSGNQIDVTNCYCKGGYMPQQTGATSWKCVKVDTTSEKQNEQIVIHDEKYTVKPNDRVVYSPQQPVSQRAPIRNHQPYQDMWPHIIMEPHTLFEPIFVPEQILFPLPTGYLNVDHWESLEINIY